MPRFVVRAEGTEWDSLRRELASMGAVAAAEQVDMNELGKSLARTVTCVRAVFVSAAMPSVRMDAAVRALDLRTPKSELERFARPS
ncbi:MAG: hypothetical protein M3Y87_02465 [Myxococcota bacterium]|nr:hypothetical protein [Myxococcota bacterium]